VNSLDRDVLEAYSSRVPNCREGSQFIGSRRREGKSLRQEMKRLATEREAFQEAIMGTEW
jgi:hypothetical protein